MVYITDLELFLGIGVRIVFTFYDTAIRAITHPEFDESLDNEHWQFGLFLQQQWLHDQGKSVVSELQRIRQGLCE